jgi:hypothetical protein
VVACLVKVAEATELSAHLRGGAFGRIPFGGGKSFQGAIVSASTFGPDFHQQTLLEEMAPIAEQVAGKPNLQ